MLGIVSGMPQPNSPTTAVRREELPLAGRSMELRSFTRAAGDDAQPDTPLATASLVFTTGAAVRRYDWFRDRPFIESLVVDESSIRLDRLQRGAPLLNTHNQWDLEAQLGVVENPAIRNGEGTCDVTFSRRPSVAGYVQDVEDRIIRNVSVGYVRHRVEMVSPAEEGGLWEYRVIDWEPMEVSLVPIPADMDSQIRSGGQQPGADGSEHQIRTFPCEFIETRATPSTPTVGSTAETSTEGTRSMPQDLNAAGGTTAPASTAAPAAVVTAAAPAAAPTVDTRAADIADLCQRHGMPQLAGGMIRNGDTVDAARALVLDELARRDTSGGGHQNVVVQTVRDEHATRMAGMSEAIMHRMDPAATLTDAGRQYRGLSLTEMARESLEGLGVSTRGLSRNEIATRAFAVRAAGYHTTGDFPSLLGGVGARRLRAAYELAPSTFQLWARRAANLPDFRITNVLAVGGAPELKKLNEAGEYTYGTISEDATSYRAFSYGRAIALTRHMFVNDDLSAFDRLLQRFGESARRLENRLVYDQITGNPAMQDGKALFHADHGNLLTAASALSLENMGKARALMRKQKDLDGKAVLNLAPAYLIVPSDLEQLAYTYTSGNYVPAKVTDVNEFRAGGRTAVEPVVEPLLDEVSATAWYMAARSGQIDTVEFAYVDGSEGVRTETFASEDIDGVKVRATLDFAAKVIDWRGLNKATGAA